MGKGRKGYNTKGKNYRKNRIDKLRVKCRKKYEEYLIAYEKGNLTDYMKRSCNQFILDKWRHRKNVWEEKG